MSSLNPGLQNAQGYFFQSKLLLWLQPQLCWQYHLFFRYMWRYSCTCLSSNLPVINGLPKEALGTSVGSSGVRKGRFVFSTEQSNGTFWNMKFPYSTGISENSCVFANQQSVSVWKLGVLSILGQGFQCFYDFIMVVSTDWYFINTCQFCLIDYF